MLGIEDTFLEEIENTLDQLILHAKILQSSESLNTTEICLIKKTQESLLAKFWHIQDYLEYSYLKNQENCSRVLSKIQELHTLSPTLVSNFSKYLTKNPSLESRFRIGRNRKKLRSYSLK
jgi:hypothetical protein